MCDGRAQLSAHGTGNDIQERQEAVSRAARDDFQFAVLLEPFKGGNEIVTVLLRKGVASLQEPLEVHLRKPTKLRLKPRPVSLFRRQFTELVDVTFESRRL